MIQADGIIAVACINCQLVGEVLLLIVAACVILIRFFFCGRSFDRIISFSRIDAQRIVSAGHGRIDSVITGRSVNCNISAAADLYGIMQ